MQSERTGPGPLGACVLGILVGAASLSISGCSPGEPEARFEVQARWAATDAHERFDARALLAPRAGPAPASSCRLRPDPVRTDLEQIVCDSVGAEAPLRLELTVEGGNLAPVRLLEPGGPEPRAAARAETADGVTATYRYLLDPRPAGAPDAAWIFSPVGAAAGKLSRPRLRVVPVERTAAAAAAAVARPWKFDLDREWRTGALALPDQPVRWRLAAVPRGARLETAIASSGSPLRFRIVDETAGRDRVLLEGALGAGSASWRPLTAALDAENGAGVSLRFEVETDSSGAWGAWAEPLLLAPASRPRRPDLLLVVLDTVRADRLTPYGASAGATPFLGEFARDRALVFERAVTPSSWTFPAHVSLMSGLEAFRHGAFTEDDAGVPPHLPSLAGWLRAAGYRTLAVTADGFVHPRLGFATGFDRYAYFDYQKDAEHELERGVDRALASLGELAGQPVFLFFHTYEAHVPNRRRGTPAPAGGPAPADLEVVGHQGSPGPETGFYGAPGFQIRDRRTHALRAATSEDAPLLADLYGEAVLHIDAELRRLAAGLAGAGRWDGSLIAVTSDHGESLGEHGRMSHTWLDEANVHVPLLVAWPDGLAAGRRAPELVSLVDLGPTLLEAAGVAPPAGLDGQPLRPLPERGAAARQRAWSYVAANNHGLALLLPDARKLVLLDAAWRSTPARLRWIDPARDPSETLGAASVEPGVEQLAVAARRALAQGLPGLRIEVANRTAQAVDLLLRHPGLSAGYVKMPEPGPELEWVRPGRARARLAPGERGGWILLGARSDRIDLEGELRLDSSASGPLAIRVHEPAPAGGRTLGFAAESGASRWRTGAAGKGEVGLELGWRGTLERAPAAPAEMDDELRRALDALGYLG